MVRQLAVLLYEVLNLCIKSVEFLDLLDSDTFKVLVQLREAVHGIVRSRGW